MLKYVTKFSYIFPLCVGEKYRYIFWKEEIMKETVWENFKMFTWV